MPKPLNLPKTKTLIRTLFPEDRVKVVVKDNWNLVYFNQDAEAKFAEHSLDELVRSATIEAYKKEND